jgi:hypothetical protein
MSLELAQPLLSNTLTRYLVVNCGFANGVGQFEQDSVFGGVHE